MVNIKANIHHFKISIPNNELVLDFIDMSNSLIVDNHWNEAFVKNYNDLN